MQSDSLQAKIRQTCRHVPEQIADSGWDVSYAIVLHTSNSEREKGPSIPFPIRSLATFLFIM